MFECTACDLSLIRTNEPTLVDIPATAPTVLFIGEPLYDGEEATLESGSSLGYLIETAKDTGIKFGENAAYMSAPRCHVPRSTDQALVSRSARKCHKLHLDRVTKELDVNIVVVVGAAAAAYMPRSIISECKANKFTHSYRSIVPDRVYFYVEDGAFIYEKLEEKDQGPMEDFIMTLKHIKMTADIGIKRTPVDYQFIDTIDKAIEVYQVLKTKKELAVDIETSGLNKFSDKAKILTISFTWEEYQAVCFPVEHEESPFNQEEQQVIKDLLNDVLSDPNITEVIFHNGKFDDGYMSQRGINTLNFNYDTMLAHYTLDETRGSHGLKKLALVYTDLGDYDSGLHQFMANAKLDLTDGYSKVPLEILWQYNCCDTDATLRLKHIFEKKMQVEGTEPLFRYLMKLSAAFTTIEKAGFAIDDSLLVKLENDMPLQIDALESKFFSFSEVVETQRRLQQDEVDKCLREDIERLAKSKSGRTKPKKPEIIHFNPASVNHMRALLFDTLKLQNVLPIDTINEYLTKKGQGEIDDDLICHTDDIPTEFLSTGKKTLNFINDLEHNEVVSTLLEHRSIKKLYGTYIKPMRSEWKSSDGLIHSTNLLHGTASGRLAATNPNMQNIPRGSLIKQLFISRWEGGYFGQLDYSQVELRVAAILSGDPKLLEAYASGLDIHKQTASLVFGVHITEVTKEQRQYAKAINFGLIYGKKAWSLAAELNITEEEAQQFIDRYFATFSRLYDWIEENKKKFIREECATSMFGRVRKFPGLNQLSKIRQKSFDQGKRYNKNLREAGNHVIQSTAADFTLNSVILLLEYFKEQGLKSLVLGTVYDSIMIDIYPGEEADVINSSKMIMENIDKLLGLDWVTVKLEADAEIGPNWGNLGKVVSSDEEYKFEKGDKVFDLRTNIMAKYNEDTQEYELC